MLVLSCLVDTICIISNCNGLILKLNLACFSYEPFNWYYRDISYHQGLYYLLALEHIDGLGQTGERILVVRSIVLYFIELYADLMKLIDLVMTHLDVLIEEILRLFAKSARTFAC